MKCIECQKKLSDNQLNEALVTYRVPLCTKHKKRLDGLIEKHKTPIEAIQLYYGLKQANVRPMLEWWNGKRSVDIAISRAKLNIIIDTEYERARMPWLVVFGGCCGTDLRHVKAIAHALVG